jgi:hypothetical protein
MKEIKVTIEGIGINTTENSTVQVRAVLLDNGKVIDMIIIQMKSPYDKLEMLKVE